MTKVKVRPFADLTDKELEEIKAIQIRKCKAFYQARPFVTPLYISMKLGVPLQFILDNKKEIGI